METMGNKFPAICELGFCPHFTRLERDRAELMGALLELEQWAVNSSDEYPAETWGAYPPDAIVNARALLARLNKETT